MNKFPPAQDAIWEQSFHLASHNLEVATSWIDKQFGKDFAKKHPELLASFIAATMTGYAGSVIAAAIQDSRGRE